MKPLRVLVACEESQAVTQAFRDLGHEAYSNDLLPCSGGHPEWHIKATWQYPFKEHGPWDLVVAFPPCTDLAVSEAKWFAEKRRDGRQQASIEFFLEFTKLTCPWAIENPIGIMSTHYRKPDQIVQPWQFGHGETKATCLWLNKLPKLVPTDVVSGREQRVWRMGPSPERAMLRSKTYEGIARAMATQFSEALLA